LSNNPQADPM